MKRDPGFRRSKQCGLAVPAGLPGGSVTGVFAVGVRKRKMMSLGSTGASVRQL